MEILPHWLAYFLTPYPLLLTPIFLFSYFLFPEYYLINLYACAAFPFVIIII